MNEENHINCFYDESFKRIVETLLYSTANDYQNNKHFYEGMEIVLVEVLNLWHVCSPKVLIEVSGSEFPNTIDTFKVTVYAKSWDNEHDYTKKEFKFNLDKIIKKIDNESN